MNRRHSDIALTFALSASLAAHAGLGLLILRERIAELTRTIHQPPLVAAASVSRDKLPTAAPDPDPLPILQSPPDPIEDFAEVPPPRPTVPPPPPEKPRKPADENLEWGEKDGKGFAVTSAPGEREMSARKGNEDQAFASRDAEGPELRPDDPSPSTAPPGQNGDGKPNLQQALQGHGTEPDPLAPPDVPKLPSVPPPPVPYRATLARVDTGSVTPQTSGRSTSLLPAPEPRSPAERQSPSTERNALPNDFAWGDAAQLLPVKRSDVIGIPSAEPAYPDVVAALTRPPGLKPSDAQLKSLDSPVLPATVAAADPASAAVQPATAALLLPDVHPEEMARRLGESDPLTHPAIADALDHPPGATDLTGGPEPLPDIAMAAPASSPQLADAIAPLASDLPRPDEQLAQRVEPPTPPTPQSAESPQTATASAQGGVPGAPVPAADPAPDTGLESDPFAKIPGVEFRNGKVAARTGRQIKPVRPRLSEIAQRDLLGLQFPTILARVRIDKTGKVTDVTVLRGSGSQAVDQPVYRALWNWWFEPPKDKKGNPLEDVQLVSIHWS